MTKTTYQSSCQTMENGFMKGELLTISGRPAVLQPRKKENSPREPRKKTPNKKSKYKIPNVRPTVGLVSNQRKLVLHFDVRNTVLVADSVTRIGVEQALNSYLTGVTWGFERNNGEWQWVSDEPSLEAPAENCVTYYKHLEKQLVRTPADRGKLREMLGDFTREDIGSKFRPYFEKALDSFEWKHDTHEDILVMKGQNGKMYHYILPSVFHLMQYLHDAKRDYAIIIRTYGMDAPNVLKAISHSLSGKHVDFPNLPKNINVNMTPGHIERSKDGSIKVKIAGDDKHLHDEVEMYKFLSELNGVCAFIDDFQFWQDNDYSSFCAKPLWVDPSDRSVHHIIFDDNIRLTDSDSIVDLRLMNRGEGQQKFKSVPHELTEDFENMCLVHADLLKSTENMNYFIDKVQLCEKNYSKFLESS